MPFVSQHVSHSHTLRVNAPIERVFPLFEPLGERAWATGWQPVMLYPPSGAARAGTVFTTDYDGEDTTIWTIAAYDATAGLITYHRVTPGSRAGIIAIHCAATSDGATDATITYTFTALSDAGNDFIAGFTAAHYAREMALWEAALNHYLLHGEPLHHA